MVQCSEYVTALSLIPRAHDEKMRAGLLLPLSLLRVPLNKSPTSVAFARMASVTGTIYDGPKDAPTVTLFTKEGCTLCEAAKSVLATAAAKHPHTLMAIDITDTDHTEWWDRYKYDIPVLHVDGVYWAKHRQDA